MANPHSREFSPRKRRPPAAYYSPYFQDDTASTAGAVPPWPLSAADFMDVQLRELARLNDRMNRLSQQFNPLIEACLTGTVPIDVLTAVCLVHLRGEVHELTERAEQVTASNYRRWIQVNARRQPEER